MEFLESGSSVASSIIRLVPLRGVFLCTETRRAILGPCGTRISDKGSTPTTEAPRLCRVRLSLRRSRRVFSPRTAPARVNPAELEPEADSSVVCVLEAALALSVSIVNPAAAGVLGRTPGVSSTQLAGVGGTGPRAAIPLGGGRRVGGAIVGAGFTVRFKLCEREPGPGGGGPGGGGGRGIPGSHLVCEADRDRAEVGVSIALVETARREFGGSGSVSDRSRGRGICTVRGWGRDGGAGGWGSGDVCVSGSRSLRLPSDGRPNRRSLEAPRPLVPGGGGKF